MLSCAVGDLMGKHGQVSLPMYPTMTALDFTDYNLPVLNNLPSESIIGRSVVLIKANGRVLSCATIYKGSGTTSITYKDKSSHIDLFGPASPVGRAVLVQGTAKVAGGVKPVEMCSSLQWKVQHHCNTTAAPLQHHCNTTAILLQAPLVQKRVKAIFEGPDVFGKVTFSQVVLPGYNPSHSVTQHRGSISHHTSPQARQHLPHYDGRRPWKSGHLWLLGARLAYPHCCRGQ
jgi:hypothetical protein